MTPKPHYRRVLLKLSGEALMGNNSFGVSPEACQKIALSIKEAVSQAIQVAVVLGAGNIFRGMHGVEDLGLTRTPADHMGMLGTIINGIALHQALTQIGCEARVMSALECPKVVETYNWSRAIDHIESGSVLIFVGGTGNPYFTTDTAASLRANEINADILMKATKVDGVYDQDPFKNPSAKKYSSITFSQVLQDKLNVMDAAAIALSRDSTIPIFVFNFGKHSLLSAIEHPEVGTMITESTNS